MRGSAVQEVKFKLLGEPLEAFGYLPAGQGIESEVAAASVILIAHMSASNELEVK